MARQQISPVIAERRCPNCGTRVARDAESCFMCGHDLRIQKKRKQRVSWVDALLVFAVLAVLAVWWRIASSPRPDEVQAGNIAGILPTNVPILTATVLPTMTLIISDVATPIPTPGENGVLRHRVQQGETLLGIAEQYGVTVEEIQAANNINDVLIRAEDVLIIPVRQADAAPPASAPSINAGGTTVGSRFEYTVQPGDTVISIANRFGSTVEEILIANSLTNNDFILPADVLLIPVPEVPSEVLASIRDTSSDAIYVEPRLIGPPTETTLPVTEPALLRWISVDVLAPNEWYVLLIYPISGSAQSFPSIWTKSTSYRLDSAFAPTNGDTATYAWQVSVVRVKPGTNNQYALDAASPPSELRSFTWR